MTKSKTEGAKLHAGFGIVAWGEGQDPFPVHLEVLKSTAAPETLQESATLTHADLTTARAIAISLFGLEWKDFVMDVYDRLRDRVEELEEGD